MGMGTGTVMATATATVKMQPARCLFGKAANSVRGHPQLGGSQMAVDGDLFEKIL